MKNIFYSLVFAAVVFSSCEKGEKGDTGPQGPAGTNNPAPLPVACFTVDDTLTYDSLQLFSFTNCSQNAVQYEWDFGDYAYAPVANPKHAYNHSGLFTVRLKVYNADNVSAEATQVIKIGYYRLTKFDFVQLYPSLTFPVATRFYSAFFNEYDTLSQGSLPFTRTFPPLSNYDMTGASDIYTLRVTDSLGVNFTRSVAVLADSIANNQRDITYFFNTNDSVNVAKMTLYFQFIHN